MRKFAFAIAGTLFAWCLLLPTVLHAQASTAKPTKPPAREKKAAAAATREDWGNLSIAGSDLKPETPVLVQKDDRPKFVRELIRVQWRAHDPIDLYVIKPKDVERPPVILYLYSYPSETERFRDNDYCERLVFGGYAAVGFVSALTGQRYHSRPMKEWFVSELQESLGSSVHDVQMILNYLTTRGDLDVSHAGMFGEGSGGSIAVLAAASDLRLKAIDLLDPWGDWPTWMAESELVPEAERPNFLKPEFLKKVGAMDPVQWLPSLHAKIRLQQTAEDPASPKTAKDKFSAAVPKNSEVVTDQTSSDLFSNVSGGRLFQWLKQQLRPAQPPQTPPAN
jgi:dienelactone hydrolase